MWLLSSRASSMIVRRLKPFQQLVLFLQLFSLLLPSSFLVAQNGEVQDELYTAEAKAKGFEAKDQFHNAIEVWQRVLQENPNRSQAYWGIARNYMRLGRYNEALASVDQSLLLANQNYKVSILKSQILMGLKHYDEAKDLLFQLRQNNTSYQIDLTLAEIFAILGDLASSVDYLNSIKDFASNNLDFILISLMVYEEADKIEMADGYLRQALELYYNEVVVHKVAAEFYFRRGRYMDVLDEVGVIKHLGIDTEEQRLLGLEAAYLKGDYQLAINLAETLVTLYPKNSKAWYMLGLAYSNIALLNKALNALDTARRIDPDDELVEIVIAEILRTRYPYPSKWHSEEAEHYIAKAKAKREELLYDEALQDYRIALQIDPLNKDNWMAFANVFRDRGNYAKYLDKLYAWKQFGVSSGADSKQLAPVKSELDRLIAIYKASQHQSVAQNWGLPQYTYSNNYYPVQVFVVKSRSFDYIGAPRELGTCFVNILQWYEQPSILDNLHVVEDHLQAQQIAYTSKHSDYYIILNFTKQGYGFRSEVDLYRSSTGRKIKSFNMEKVSNGRIYSSFSYLAQQLHSLFPKKARIIEARTSRVAFSLGSLDGVKEGQEWLILPESALSLSAEKPFAEYEDKKVIGSMTVTATDEKISEGQVKLRSYVNPVKDGYIALLPIGEQNAGQGKPSTSSELQLNQQLFQEPNIRLQDRLLEIS